MKNMEMENVIEIKNLKKYFGGVKAVDDISFSVAKGEFFAFLGVNGAGKSTTISILCGKLPRTAGEVLIGGKEIQTHLDEAKRKLGVVFQNSVLDAPLSVEENLRCRAGLYGIGGAAYKKRLDELIVLFDLKDLLRRPVGKLSGGQRRRAPFCTIPKFSFSTNPRRGSIRKRANRFGKSSCSCAANARSRCF